VEGTIQRRYHGHIRGKYTLRDVVYREQQQQGIKFTGYVYGDENEYPCLACGEAGHTYKIYSTTLDEWIVTEWKDAMVRALRAEYGNDSAKMNRDYRGKMIGVMYAGGRWYASHSGAHLKWIYQALPAGLAYLNWNDGDDVRTWGGYEVSRRNFAACQIPHSPGILQCAGAKLARHVARFGAAAPVYMTEMWVDPNHTHADYVHGAITESCLTCREQVATLMCPRTPGEIAELWREEERASVFPPYTRGESRQPREFQLLEDISAYPEPRPTLFAGFTLKKGAKISVNAFDQDHYRVKLVSGLAQYNRTGRPTQTVLPDAAFIPPIYVNAMTFNKNLMDLVW
jgi:hypothetical protein